MKNVVAAFNSSIQFNKHNFWIDPKNKNQYFVGVQYYEQDIKSIETLMDIPVTTDRPDVPKRPIPLRNVVSVELTAVATEVTHYNIQPTIELTMGVFGRDLGHVSDDVSLVSNKFGSLDKPGNWSPYDPESNEKRILPGSKIVLSGEYLRMKETFSSLAIGLDPGVAADLLPDGRARQIVRGSALGDVDRAALPGRHFADLYFTGSAVNVQSLLGFIFIVGIKVANSVLMTDYAQELRRHEGLTPFQAIRKAASRARPADHDDGPGGVLRLDSGGDGTRTRQRSQCPAGPRNPGRADGGRAGHAVHPACDLYLARQGIRQRPGRARGTPELSPGAR